MIEIDRDLKDILICSLRYALGRKTYITLLVSEYIKNHSELIDYRVKQVMLMDLEKYFEYRKSCCYDDECDYNSWLSLKQFLEDLKMA